jgi:hypothetical protein
MPAIARYSQGPRRKDVDYEHPRSLKYQSEPPPDLVERGLRRGADGGGDKVHATLGVHAPSGSLCGAMPGSGPLWAARTDPDPQRRSVSGRNTTCRNVQSVSAADTQLDVFPTKAVRQTSNGSAEPAQSSCSAQGTLSRFERCAPPIWL